MKKILIILIFSLGTILLIYNQLLQANQIYIFSLIPILAAILHKNLDTAYGNKIIFLGKIKRKIH